MSLAQFTQPWVARDTTENYAWVKAFSDAFTTLGMVKESSVTGQVDLSGTTLAIPGTIVTGTTYAVGYEVRKLVAASRPTMYVRIDYSVYAAGGATAANLIPKLTFSYGSAVSTGGVLGGTTSSFKHSSYTISSFNSSGLDAIARPVYVASDGANYFSVVVDPAGMTRPTKPVVAIAGERSISPSTGAYTSDGFVAIGFTDTADGGVIAFNLAGSSVLRSSNVLHTFPPSAYLTSSGAGSAVTLFPSPVLLPAPMAPMSVVLGYLGADINPGVLFSTTLYGNAINYLALLSPPVTYGNTTSQVPALRVS